MYVLRTIAIVLLIIGGLNWGLVGLFDFDLVAALFGARTSVTRAVYILVGLAAVVKAAFMLDHATRSTVEAP